MLPDTIVKEAKTSPLWKPVNMAFREIRRFPQTEFEYSSGSQAARMFSPWSETQDARLAEINSDVWLQLAAIIERPASVEHAIYVRFYNIEQVQSIYVQSLREVYNIFLFLKQDHYDDELMDRLLDQEGKILDVYQDTLFQFHYLPLLKDRRPSQSISKNSVMIFSR